MLRGFCCTPCTPASPAPYRPCLRDSLGAGTRKECLGQGVFPDEDGRGGVADRGADLGAFGFS